MAERKIIVPEGMLKAFHNAETHDGHKWDDAVLDVMLEAAAHWLSEHLPLPSINDDAYSGPEWATGWNCGIEAVRRMFLAREMQVAEIDARIPDLLFNYPTHVGLEIANETIRQAFLRGMEAGKSE